jgi:zinc transporter ZupT
MSTHSVDLTIFKVLVGAALAIATFGGAVVPRLFKSYDPVACQRWLPLGNCLSGGLLLGAGLLHFFTGAASSLADVDGHPDCGDASKAALERAASVMLGGFFVSLFIDRVLLRSEQLTAAASQHGHSHDVGPPSSSSDVSASDVLDQDASGTSTFIVAVLLGFHAALEGVSLAYEPTAAALRNGFVPLVLHKFFDGLLLGIQAAKAPLPGEPAVSKSRSIVRDDGSVITIDHFDESGPTSVHGNSKPSSVSQPFLCAVGSWASITPIVMIAVVFAGVGFEAAVAAEATKSPLDTAYPLGPQFQCFGAGTFLYVAMMEVLTSEFKPHPPKRRLPGAFATPTWSHTLKLFTVIAGCVIVSFLESGHHHSH